VIDGRAAVTTPPQLDELTQQILRVVVDECELSTNDGVAEFRATKRPAPTE
jgi:hypothetical protein